MRFLRRAILGTALLALGPAFVAADEGPAVEKALLQGQPREEYRARRVELMKRLSEAAPESIVVLRGADDPDIEGKFRQANTFLYLTGFDQPDAYLLLVPGENREVLYVPAANIESGRMNSPRAAPGPDTAARFGIAKVESTERLLGDLFGAIGDPQVLRGNRRVVYTQAVNAPATAAGATARFTRLLREGSPNTAFRDLTPVVAAMRQTKSPAELEILRRAIAITSEAQREVVRAIRPGIPEYVLEGKVLGAFVTGGASGAAFPSIIGSGPNSTIPHYFANDRTIGEGELVVVDIGASYKSYAADITRTYPASGKFSPRQLEVYRLVLDAQRAVEAEMKPGKTKLSDMAEFTREFLDRSPLRAKDEDGKEWPMGHFFIHGLGHYLGMDVHDVGDYEKPVNVGDVFTIEPGIYILGENLGVRIEDDYVMTEQCPKKLSAEIPSDPAEIERLIAEARGTAGGSR